ncbi:MAG: peptidoglycan bridge formation glycyltransferase FemA/FemB family protein [Ignavibacterium sp.]|nr:peptidoglycan bridge formation glycyltransferase FemA/FemB family protein [Ignavibacterium sp.]
MEIIKETYTKELRTEVKNTPVNFSEYLLINELLIDGNKYQVYASPNILDEQWDKFVMSVQGSWVFQLSGWVEVKQLEGWDFKRIIYVKENSIVGGYQILTKKLPFPLKIGYINHGPVLNTSDSKIITQIVTDFEKFCTEQKINVSIINPPEKPKELVDELSRRYLKNNIYNVIVAEAELDISKEDEVLFKNFLRMRKQNIHKSSKYEFKVVEGNENELDIFFNLMNETCKRNKVKPNPPSLSSLKRIWEFYHSKNLLNLYNFYIKDELVSSIMAFEYQDTFTPWKFGWSGNKSSYKPNDVFHWELIKIAKRKGFTKYNFGGINKTTAENFLDCSKKLSPEEQKSSTFFKMGFGCYIKYLPGSVIYIPNPILKMFYRFYLFLKAAKTRFRKLLRINLPAHILIFK